MKTRMGRWLAWRLIRVAHRLHSCDCRDTFTVALNSEAVFRAEVMSSWFCDYRWDSDTPDPGPCQCVRDNWHDGPHRCCCGSEADDE